MDLLRGLWEHTGLLTVNCHDLLHRLVSALAITLQQLATLKEFGRCNREELGMHPAWQDMRPATPEKKHHWAQPVLSGRSLQPALEAKKPKGGATSAPKTTGPLSESRKRDLAAVVAAYSKKKKAQKVQRGLKGKEFQSSEESASEFESSSDEVVESRSENEVEAVQPETQDTQLSLPARKDLPWVWLPLLHEKSWTPFPGVQIVKLRPTHLLVPRGVLRGLQKNRGLGHIDRPPNDREGDWQADGEHIFFHKVETTKEGAQKVCEFAEASGGVQVESRRSLRRRKGKVGR